MTSEKKMRQALQEIKGVVDNCHSSTFGSDLSIIHGIAMSALHSVEAEKEPEWISCDEKMPDDEEIVWPWYPGEQRDLQEQPCTGRFMALIAMNFRGSKWKPTSIRRPAPPEHKPE